MKSAMKILGLAILALAAAVLVLRLFFFDLVLVKGEDMMPGIKNGTWVLVSRRATPVRGDLVMFRTKEGTHLVRRVVGLPGETVATAKGRPVVQGKEAAQEEVRTFVEQGRKFRVMRETMGGRSWEVVDDTMRTMSDLEPTVVGDGFYVLADHREHARDSREMGTIPRSAVRGVVIAEF